MSASEGRAWADLVNRHVARIRQAAPEPVENDEPCVCDTDFTCMADEHEVQP